MKRQISKIYLKNNPFSAFYPCFWLEVWFKLTWEYFQASRGAPAAAQPARPANISRTEILTPFVENRRVVKVMSTPDLRKCKNMAQRRVYGALLARKMAFAEMGKAVLGMAINAETTVADERLRAHYLEESIDSFIMGARETEPVAVESNPDGSENYTVTLEVLINDESGLSKLLLPYLQRTQSDYKAFVPSQPAPGGGATSAQGASAPQPAKTTAKPPLRTGLVIDARGLSLLPALAPKILVPDGRVVYGLRSMSLDKLQKYGLVGYARTLEKAAASGRAGNDPLVVKAASARKNIDVVVDLETGADISYADTIGDFLGKGKVVIVLD